MIVSNIFFTKLSSYAFALLAAKITNGYQLLFIYFYLALFVFAKFYYIKC